MPGLCGGEVAEALKTAKDKSVEAAGFIQHTSQATGMATSKGLRAFRKTTAVAYSVTMRSTNAGSGWGGAVANSCVRAR